jgi:MFS family permease
MTSAAMVPIRRQATIVVVGALFFVEITSGILQGYYIPLVSHIVRHLGIRDADYNWFEAAQLLLSALAVPILSRLGDLFGHKRILLVSTALTALASWGLLLSGNFWTYLIFWALQGFYVVWLPLEVALIMDRGRKTSEDAPAQTRRAAGLLVVALELGAIVGALSGARVLSGTGSVLATLAVPASVVTICFFVILIWVKESERGARGSLDGGGFALLALALLCVMGSLSFLHLNGLGTWWAWLLMVVGIGLIYPFYRHVKDRPDPAVDLRTLRNPAMWPIQLTAFLGGVSLLGAQIPLSTFAATNPSHGYGLGLSADVISYLTGGYLVSLVVGALLQPIASRVWTPRTAIIAGAAINALGYLLFIPFHNTTPEVITALCISGIGSGAMVAALPAAAAAAAPFGQSGIASGLTNTGKTVGGAFASATFGILLGSGVAEVAGAASSLSGYLAVWTICGLTALAAAIVLVFVPKTAFTGTVTLDSSSPEEITDSVR